MKQYILIKKDELTLEILNAIKSSPGVKEHTVLMADESDSGYILVSFFDGKVPKVLSTYKRHDSESVQAAIADIQASRAPNIYKPITTRNSAFFESEGKRVRFKGCFKITANAQSSASQDFLVTEDRMLTGAVYHMWDGTVGNRVDLEVVHPTLGVIERFVEGWYVSHHEVVVQVYPALIKAGLTLRATFYNDDVLPSSVTVNLLLHKA